MWQLGPFEMGAVQTGLSKWRAWLYELALFTAWHVAAFGAQAYAGKLESWSSIRKKFSGATTVTHAAPEKKDWRLERDLRKAQMEQFKKHMQARKTVPKVTGAQRRSHV